MKQVIAIVKPYLAEKVLEALNLLSDEESERLGDMREPLVMNRLGRKVGDIKADMSPRLVPETAPL